MASAPMTPAAKSGMTGDFMNMLMQGIGMGTQQDPGDAASKFMDQIGPMLKGYYQPYIGAGLTDLGMLQGQLKGLTQDPAGLYNQLASGYTSSPLYQQETSQATQGANRAAAAGGQVGSPAEQQALGKQISGYASRDMDDYMRQVMGNYQLGMQGLSGMNQMGFAASTGLGANLANLLQSQGNLAYTGAQAANKQQAGLLGTIGKFAGDIPGIDNILPAIGGWLSSIF